MSVTLKNIAEKAGVSISTVSRILNNDSKKKASSETQKRVLALVQEMGYVPNPYARRLAQTEEKESSFKEKHLGVVYTPTKDPWTDPFFSGVTIGIQMQAAKLGFKIAYSFSSFNQASEDIGKQMNDMTVDGIIILGRFSEDFLQLICRHNTNIVYAGLNSVNLRISEVICDSQKAIAKGVDHLCSLGHKSIGYIGPHIRQYNITAINEHRYDAFCASLKANGVELNEGIVKLTGTDIESGYNAMMELIDEGNLPTAIQCGCDEIAIGAINAMTKRKIRIPEDVAIVGLEDIEVVSYLQPALTTIHAPSIEIGSWAVNLVEAKYNKTLNYPIRMEFPSKLVVRASCGKYKTWQP